jgi:hypothetical protein
MIRLFFEIIPGQTFRYLVEEYTIDDDGFYHFTDLKD